MPAARTKSDLIAVTTREWARLSGLLDDLPRSLADLKDANGVAIKDILTHRAHWIGLFFTWLDAGDAAQMPDRGVTWAQLQPYNAGLRQQYAGMHWCEARDWLSTQHRRLDGWLHEAPEAQLYGAPMPGGTGWATGRYAEAAGASHYRSAAKYIRSRLRAARPVPSFSAQRPARMMEQASV
jgi:hypothetical protein